MCDYTKVEYACGHLRYTVRAWCKRDLPDLTEETKLTCLAGFKYQETHKRCPANVVAIEYRLDEKCGKATRSF